VHPVNVQWRKAENLREVGGGGGGSFERGGDSNFWERNRPLMYLKGCHQMPSKPISRRLQGGIHVADKGPGEKSGVDRRRT